jgi:AcrR family transcriptional regulator
MARLAPPARLPRLQRREQLLDVTREIVDEAGFHAVSIDRVARAAGISRPIVYEHFSDLAGLLGALLEREGRRAIAQVEAALPAREASGQPGAGTPVTEVLIETLGAFLDAVSSDPVTWRLMLMPPEGAPTFLRTGIEQTRATVVARLTELLAPGGALTSPDPPMLATSIQVLAVHWARLMLLDPARFDRPRILAGARWAIDRLAAG